MAGGSPLSSCDVFEVLVMLFQVCGIMGLCSHRLMPRSTAWSSRGQVGSIIALFGLGIAGALVRPPRFGICPVRWWDDDGPADWHDDGEWVDRAVRAGGSGCDDASQSWQPEDCSKTVSALPVIVRTSIRGQSAPIFFCRDLTGPKTRAIVSAMMGISGLVLPVFTS